MMETQAKELRRSGRKTQGQKPQRFLTGDETGVIKRTTAEDQSASEDLLDFGPPTLSRYGSKISLEVNDLVGSKSVYSVKTTSSKKSFLRRQERDLEIEKAEELARIREDFEAKQMQRRIFLTEKRFEAEKANLLDEMDEDSEDGSMNSREKIPLPRKQEEGKVENWLDDLRMDEATTTLLQDQNVKTPETSMDQLINGLGKVILAASRPQESSSLQHLMARQTVGRDLPIFSGKPEEWPTFQQQFRRSTQLCNFTADENLSRLQKSLKGIAKETVAAMMYSPNNLEIVMKTLERRFGRPDHIIEILIEKAKATSSPKESDLESLISFSNAVMNLTMTMESLNCPHHLHNPQLLKELMMKLPSNLRLKWGKLISKSDNANFSLKDFACWLDSLATSASLVSQPRQIKDDNNDNRHAHQPQKKREAVFTSVNRGGRRQERALLYSL